MAADRSIKVVLRAEVSQYKQAMDGAAQATEQVGSAAGKSSTQAESSFGRMLQSAQQNREAWTQVGGAMTVAGGAILGVGAAALRTGIQYNTLQQTTRAALTTLLGSAEAANAQMDKLDEFARSSPFAKQTFIQAQQQMLGFGVAAEDVLPALDAIQNTVAAFGGSNEQIAAIAEILSRIKSEGRLSGDALQRMGYYGVDAAAIIGEQMGMTAVEIRDMASEPGGIPVAQIWDPLVNGMQEKFGGAADGVKNTFAGAMDRVKAAWRDFSSELATPLVDPNGGGALVDLLNWAADAMRAFERLPSPVKTAATGLAGVAGAALTVGGAFVMLAPRIADNIDRFRAFNAEHPRTASGLGKVAGAATRVGGAAVALGTVAVALNELHYASMEAIPSVERLTASLLESEGVAGAESAFSGISKTFDDMKGAADRLVDGGFNVWMDRNVGSALGMTTATSRAADAFEQLGHSLARIYESDPAEAEARFQAAMAETGRTREQLLELMGPYADALAETDVQQGLAAASAGAMADGLGQVNPALEAAAEAAESFTQTASGAFASFIDPAGAFQAAIDKQRAFAEEAAAATEDSGDSWEDFYDGHAVSGSQFIEQLESQVAAQESWASNMTGLSKRVNESMTGDMRDAANQMIDELMTLGPEGAAAVQALHGMSDAELAKVVELYLRKGRSSGDEFASQIARTRPPAIPVDADTGPARSEGAALVSYLAGLRATIGVGVETSAAQMALNGFINRNSGRRIIVGTSMVEARASGGLVGFADGGVVPGTPPADPMQDNVLAITQHGTPFALRSGEFVQSEPAVQHYGLSFMHAINQRRIPKEALRGFAAGGSVPTHYAVPSSAAPAAAASPLNIEGMRLTGTLTVNGMEARMEAVAVGALDRSHRHVEAARATRGRRS